jgi:hypothetical protein
MTVRSLVLVAALVLPLVACSTPAPEAACTVPETVPADDLLLWLRADCDTETDSNGSMTRWQSGVGSLSAVPLDASQQPRLVPDALSRQPAVRFDGENDQLAVDLDIHPSAHPDLTVVAVFSSDTAQGRPLRKLYGADDGDYDRAAGLDDRALGGQNYVVFGGVRTGVIGDFRLDAGTTYLTVDSYAGDAFDGWTNGQATLSAAAVDHGQGPSTFFIGGTGTTFSEPWKGTISEILVYGRRLSDPERIAVEDYLAAKYNLSLGR